jgi:hypothetical protein
MDVFSNEELKQIHEIVQNWFNRKLGDCCDRRVINLMDVTVIRIKMAFEKANDYLECLGSDDDGV